MALRQNVWTIILAAVLAVVTPSYLTAQTNNWMSVRAIPKGTELIVDRKNDDRVIGILNAVTEDTIAITSDGASFIIGKDNVLKVYHAVERKRKHLVGVAGLAGGLAGAVIDAKIQGPPESQEMPGVIGFIAGAVVFGGLAERLVDDKKKGVLIYSAK